MDPYSNRELCPETFSTPITQLFGIKYPVLLAGMNVAAGPKLAATVTNCGGMGVIGGVGYTPKFLRNAIAELKADLKDKDAPFGVDLLLPKVGDGARATNKDYTKGKLDELVDIIIEEGAKLFVSAVGVPPRSVVDRLHAAGIPVMNMIGAPKHVSKALDAGCDIICAQGGEGGGHTGDIATSVLIPQVVDLCKGKKSPLTGMPVSVVCAGGVFDGRGLAMALSLGADAVWVGTRFVASTEAGAPPRHKKGVVATPADGTVRTTIYTGRPLRVITNPYVKDWEENRVAESQELRSKGILPAEHDLTNRAQAGKDIKMEERVPMLCGQAAGAVHEVKPAAEIISEMVNDAIRIMRFNAGLVRTTAKL